MLWSFEAEYQNIYFLENYAHFTVAKNQYFWENVSSALSQAIKWLFDP